MSEQQFGWNYFENEVVIGDKQDKKRMIVLVFSNFLDIPYNRKSFDELVDLLNELAEENEQQELIEEQNNVIEESSAFIIEQRKENKMNEELRKELETALTNTEKCREQLKSQLEKVREDDDADERQVHLLVNYNLELLDVKLRLKDFIEHLHLIQFD